MRHAGVDIDPATKLADGSAHDVWRRMVAAQGGDPDQPLPVARHVERVTADRDGYVVLDAWDVATVGRAAGTGRERKEDTVDATAGVELLVAPGAWVTAGQEVAAIHSASTARMETALAAATALATTTPDPRPTVPVNRVLERIGPESSVR